MQIFSWSAGNKAVAARMCDDKFVGANCIVYVIVIDTRHLPVGNQVVGSGSQLVLPVHCYFGGTAYIAPDTHIVKRTV